MLPVDYVENQPACAGCQALITAVGELASAH